MTEEQDDEDRGVPCCTLAAARWVTKIQVEGNSIGIMEFQTIMDEVVGMGPMDDEETRAQLLRATKRYNYIPPQSEDAYGDAMLREFRNLYEVS
ncbi:MAG: hypothetical protein JSW25_10415 [Thermoplasmata archaeon]|nr:MAG: hypothetical protein JSW25_10415 [Thermoplasmata archaeon]